MVKKRKKSIADNVKGGWKTTVLGIIIILATIASVFLVPGMSWWPGGFIGIGTGVILWFAPDTFINLISRFIGSTQVKVGSDPYNIPNLNNQTTGSIPPEQLIEP